MLLHSVSFTNSAIRSSVDGGLFFRVFVVLCISSASLVCMVYHRFAIEFKPFTTNALLRFIECIAEKILLIIKSWHDGSYYFSTDRFYRFPPSCPLQLSCSPYLFCLRISCSSVGQQDSPKHPCSIPLLHTKKNPMPRGIFRFICYVHMKNSAWSSKP